MKGTIISSFKVQFGKNKININRNSDKKLDYVLHWY